MRFGTRRCVFFAAGASAAAWLTGACTFPDFVVLPLTGGSAGTDSVGTAGEGAGNVGGASTDGGSSPGNGAAPSEAGQGGEPAEPVVDIGPCGQREQATHCWNHERDEDETDVDCGGARCFGCGADEACLTSRDCSTGSCVESTCARQFEVDYVRQTAENETIAPGLRTRIKYVGKGPVSLNELKLRYYFSRNSASEPILVGGDSSTQFPAGTDIGEFTTRRLVRQLRGDGVSNDAYLEIGFTDGRILLQDELVDVLSSFRAGEDDTPFNQATHHSFDTEPGLHETKNISLHYRGQRVWGNAPAIDDPPSCFHAGVNLDGAALTIGSEQWQASPASLLARYINTVVALNPATDFAEREEMLRSGFYFNDDGITLPVDNGTYALVVYVWSADGAEVGTLEAQDEARDTFRCLSFDGGGPWAALGPYRITIDDEQLRLGASGALRAGGFELRLLDE